MANLHEVDVSGYCAKCGQSSAHLVAHDIRECFGGGKVVGISHLRALRIWEEALTELEAETGLSVVGMRPLSGPVGDGQPNFPSAER